MKNFESYLLFLFVFLVNWKALFGVIIVKRFHQNESFDRFQDAEAQFGRRIVYESPIMGRLYASVPPDGCASVVPLPKNSSEYAIPFICLLKRGNCTFEEKVAAAERGGYVAAIVYNHLSDDIFPMSSNSGFLVNISAVMVGRSDGLELLKNFTFPSNDYIVAVYANHKREIEWYIIPILSVLALFIMGLVCVCIFRWHDQRQRRIRRCLTSQQLKRLPRTRFVKGETPDGNCVICLEDYNDGDRLRTLPCDHVYHARCIDPWLLKGRRVCPICKRHVFPTQRLNRSFISRLRSGVSSSAREIEDVDEDNLISESPSDVDDDSVVDEEQNSSGSLYGTFRSTSRSVSPTSNQPTESTPLVRSDALSETARKESAGALPIRPSENEPESNATGTTSLTRSSSSSTQHCHNGDALHNIPASHQNTSTPPPSTNMEQVDLPRRGSNVSVDVIVHRAPSPDNASA